MSPARINRRYAWLIAARLLACSGKRNERDAVLIEAGLPDSGLPDSGLPDSGLPDSGLPDASNDASAEPAADAPDADPPASDVTVTRYEYRFCLPSSEAQQAYVRRLWGARSVRPADQRAATS